jgi:hypothetical protein
MEEKQSTEDQQPPEDHPGEEGESHSAAKDKLPGAPSGDDDSPLGDTDQHSDA